MEYLVPYKCRKYENFILLIIFYGILTCFISSNNINSHGSFFSGSRAIVEHGHFYLDDTESFPKELNSLYDKFRFNGHVYYNKQPGQAFICSIPYFFIYHSGITYTTNWKLSTLLVVLTTSIPLYAATILMLFIIIKTITKSKLFSIITACFYGFGTILFPYSDIPHHDLLATFFLLSGFFCLFYKYRIKNNTSSWLLIISGLLTSLSIFCSLNGFLFLILNFIYTLVNGKRKAATYFCLGIFIGLLPTFLLNYIVFDNPFRFSFTAYLMYYDKPHPLAGLKLAPLKSFMLFAKSYFLDPQTSITHYFPVFLSSVIGYSFLPKEFKWEKILLPLFCILHIIYICFNQKVGLGWCMYGPRYTIESIPFALIGFSGYYFLKSAKNKILAFIYEIIRVLASLTGTVSIVICIVGSIFGAMYCTYAQNGFIFYIQAFSNGKITFDLPCIPLGLSIIAIILIIIFVYSELRISIMNSVENISQ